MKLCTPVALAAALLLVGCQRPTTGGSVPVAQLPAVGQQQIAALPLGAEAGGSRNAVYATIKNPYDGNAQAVQRGEDLFIKMNCAGCHGYGAKGGMGPSLVDTYWRYGGTPVQIYKSIAEGRPQGMPAWSPALPPEEIWRLVSYIESLGGAAKTSQYQAWLEGDTAGEKVPPEVERTLVPGAKPPPAAASAAKTGLPPGTQKP